MYYASGVLDMPGAVFTASHNPAQYNGIKMCRAGAAPIGAESGLADIKQLVIDGVESTGATGTVTERDMLGDFAAHVHSFIDPANLRPLKVVADTANGMGGLVVLPSSMGSFQLDHMYPELDGTFPNHPADPIQPENQRDLMERVLRRMPTSALRSMATPTGCFWSTRPPGRSPVRSPRRWWPARSSPSIPARQSFTT